MKKFVLALVVTALVPVQASALNTTELLATIAMPLAVAAVSDVSGVPESQLSTVVAMLNNAFVPAPQAVEIIRYVPVALVTDNGQPFVNFLQEQVTQGLTGNQFVTVVDRQLQTYYVNASPAITVTTTSNDPVVVGNDFVPQVVHTRVAAVREHPHGGPPGQLKKRSGAQTGATVVHNEPRGRDRKDDDKVKPMMSSAPPAQEKVKAQEDHGKGHEDHGKGKGKRG